MKNFVLALFLLAVAPFCTAQNPAAPKSSATQRTGILLLAHGGSALAWNEEVRHVADHTDLVMPTEIAFGMATRSSMQAAINRLAARKVTEIVAVPLFVSSHSSVIDSISYLLGQTQTKPEDLAMFAAMDNGSGGMAMDHGAMSQDHAMTSEAEKPIVSPVPIRMVSALDHHRIVARILLDRAASVSHDPAKEVVLLVAHGPVPEDENRVWLKNMDQLADQMRAQSHYSGIECLTLRDDADDPVRDAATKELRAKVQQITQSGKQVLIVPLLLSYGGIEDGLRKRLNGLSYSIPKQALLPDDRIPEWVLDSAKSAGE